MDVLASAWQAGGGLFDADLRDGFVLEVGGSSERREHMGTYTSREGTVVDAMRAAWDFSSSMRRHGEQIAMARCGEKAATQSSMHQVNECLPGYLFANRLIA